MNYERAVWTNGEEGGGHCDVCKLDSLVKVLASLTGVWKKISFLVFLQPKGECFILKVNHYTSIAVDVLKKEIVATTAFKLKYPSFGLACFHCRPKFSLGLNVNVTKSFKWLTATIPAQGVVSPSQFSAGQVTLRILHYTSGFFFFFWVNPPTTRQHLKLVLFASLVVIQRSLLTVVGRNLVLRQMEYKACGFEVFYNLW